MAIRKVHYGHLRREHQHAGIGHLRNWLRDSRFWAIVAIIILFALMLLAFLYSQPAGHTAYRPIYPYYWPYP
ncbi:MAG: hypothetical protein LLF76_13985 [Planctomycetaceae bacterium]|nr:hypothetical protein [Planctomycetaceae bacterium]